MARHTDAATRGAHDAADAAKAAEASFRAQLPKTLVMQDMAQPRMAHLLKRGQYDQPGEAGQLRLLMKRVEEKREELQQKRKDIEETLEELNNVEEACLTRLAEIGVGT